MLSHSSLLDHLDNDGGQNRNRNQDTSESSNQGRPSDTDDFTSESQPRHPQR